MRCGILGIIGVVSLALTMTGCGGDSAAGPSGNDGKIDKVRVATMPIIDVAPIYLGVKKGFFAEEGIEIELTPLQSGSAATSAVVGEAADFGLAAPIAFINAVGSGLPVKVVAPAEARVPNINGLVVKKDSPIKNAPDLNGKIIAVSALKQQAHFNITVAGDRLGADPNSFKAINLPSSDMLPAVDAGRVDAAYMTEPFITEAKEKGFNVIVNDPLLEVIGENAMVSMWITSDKMISERPEVTKKFIRALKKSNVYADGHHDEVREIIGTYTKISSETLSAMTIPEFPSEVDIATLEKTARLAGEYGFTDGTIDVGGAVYIP